MMEVFNFDKFIIGDTVSIYFFGVRHEGIVTGHNDITARSYKYGCVCRVTFSDFSDGNLDKIENLGYIGAHSRQETVDRALSRVGEQGYNIFNEQCIQFVNEVNGLPKYNRMSSILLSLLAVGLTAYVMVKAKPTLKITS